MGGLGNQLFQYAYAYSIAKKYNENLCLDLSSYKQNKKPSIYKLDIKYKTRYSISLKKNKKMIVIQFLYHIAQKIIRIHNKERIGKRIFDFLTSYGYYYNFDPYYYNDILCTKKTKYVYGYFQSEKYFDSVKKDIINQFVYNGEISEVAKHYKNLIENSNAIALHIRLGDYTKKANKYLNVCNNDYYKKSVEFINCKVKNPQFFVFTNDIESSKQLEFIPNNAIFIEGTSAEEDFFLMQQCKFFIISNSTFSWWASYLSRYDEKLTIVPFKWMNTTKDEIDIYRKDMIKIIFD